MIISYSWLSEYLPEKIEPEKLSKILTSIGLEVESLQKQETIKGGLEGLVIGEIMECHKHPDADKLTVTKVNIGHDENLQIICGAPNVATGQKVVVATIGATLHPLEGDPITIKKAKIRGIESAGMLCAEDEIGFGKNHEGIMVLPHKAKAGTHATDYFKVHAEYVFEIGLTPNRMDAMSHLGVAKDVCAYLSHHNKKPAAVKSPFKNNFKAEAVTLPIEVIIENENACKRYSGVSIEDITVAESPEWLQQKLKSIGLRPINNIVDITNFILHETGQPLHAFDLDEIKGSKVIVKNLPEGTPFITLDEKTRKLSAEDLMICNEEGPMCMAGIFGGLQSGVKTATKNIFLESAWFDPIITRKSSFRHDLRTDAATRFEKGVDISNTVNVLKRAAMLICEVAGGKIASEIIDIYPKPAEKTEVALKYHYLKKLSGKNYHSDTIKNILNSLGFDLLKEGLDEIRFAVPFSKPDITIPADIVEEIMRIDGLDNVEIPSSITISPSMESHAHEAAYKDKIANYLVGTGFSEIFTNSITNSAYYNETVLQTTVKMINSLSADLNVMRPDMMETGLETISYNLNRKNQDLQLFEFGKTYAIDEAGKYAEKKHLTIYVTGKKNIDGWKSKGEKADFYFIKGILEKIIAVAGLKITGYTAENNYKLDDCLQATIKQTAIATIGTINQQVLTRFDIKQPVFYADIDWEKITGLNKKVKIEHKDIAKFPAVYRDLSIVVDKNLKFEQVEKATHDAKVHKLQSINLFDIFESEKLGANKKSLAVNFTFLDEEKTMTDKDIDAMMSKIIASYEKELNAEIRR
jgi:phenylalanyl-tRNA synthetase beta chain